MMRSPRSTTRLWLARLLVPAALGLLCGCFNPFYPKIAAVRGKSEPPPVPSSATGVVDLFRWCWNHRAYQEYTEIFDANFRGAARETILATNGAFHGRRI